MNGSVNILLVVAISLLVLALATGAGLYIRKWQATRMQKIGVMVLCVIILAGGLGGTLYAYAWPKGPPELSSKEKAALQKMYTAVTTNVPLFYDPLTRQDANYWNVGTWHQGDSCSFNDGAYRIISIEQEYYSWCIAEAPVFSNFVNQQPIAEINDSAYQMGQIGLAADEDNNTTDVAYTNAQVWTL